MIAKITRGSSASGLSAYLHGPGTGTEHRVELADGTLHRGGVVVASSVPGVRRGETDGRRWARWMDRDIATRPGIRKPVWHCSLNLAPTDRRLTDQEWREAAAEFVAEMGVPPSHAWTAVRHDDRGIHVVVSRVDPEGSVWHARHDRRAAQRARQRIEGRFDLEAAPTRKPGPAVEESLPSLRPGVVRVEGRTWRVRRRGPQLVTDRLGADGRWRLVKNGARTLALALQRRDEPAGVEGPQARHPHSAGARQWTGPVGENGKPLITGTIPQDDPLRPRGPNPPPPGIGGPGRGPVR